MASPRSYHVFKHAHPRWPRFSHKSIWLFLVVIPLGLALGVLLVRTPTTHYLLTGHPGSTADRLGQGIVEVLNTPTKWERFLHLNIVPHFLAKESRGSPAQRECRFKDAAGIRYQTYLRTIRAKTMSLLRQRRLVYDDVERINEYIRSHL